MSVTAAIEQLPSDTIVQGAVLRRWVDAAADTLTDRAGVAWATGQDELGSARYVILRRKAAPAAPMVLVAYDDSPGIDVLAADDTSDSEIDALLNELEVPSVRGSSDAPAGLMDEMRALEERITQLEEKVAPRRPKRRSVATATVLRAVERSPGITVPELAAALAIGPVPVNRHLNKLRAEGLITEQADRWYPHGASGPKSRRRSATAQSRRSA